MRSRSGKQEGTRPRRGRAAFSVAALLLVARLAGAAPITAGPRMRRLAEQTMAEQTMDAAAAGSAVFAFGSAPNEGSLLGIGVNSPIVDMAATPTGHGYWLVGADGGIFSFGDAAYYGSTGNVHLNQPIVGMAPTPTGHGYWLVASDGGIFSFGDAAYYGSTGNVHLNQPIVGMAPTPTGHGYWLVASDGGIFSFGDAAFHGSTGNVHLNQPIVGMAPTPTGHGYWLVASDGGIFSFGDAAFHGSTGNVHLNQPIVGMAPTPTGHGYWLAAADGGIFTFGDAAFHGSEGGQQLAQAVVAIAPAHDGNGYWLVEGQKQRSSPFTPALVAALNARSGVSSAAIFNLNTGQLYQYRPGLVGITASIVKVQILGTLLQQAQAAGRFLTPAEQALAIPMIEQSDNNAASALYSAAGGPGGVFAFDRSAGLFSTFPGQAWGFTTTTAQDQVTLIDHLVVPNAVLTNASRAYALGLMEHVTPSQAWGVSAGVAPGVTVALKNGWLPVNGGWTVNSIGWVNGAGRNYVIAVITDSEPTEGSGIDTISQIAAASFAALGS